MATNHTEHFDLCQWEATDRVLRTDFNEDNAKIDSALNELQEKKGNCRLVHGTYVGTGIYGSFNNNTLTFERRPLAVILAGSYTMVIPGTVENGSSTPVSSGINSYSSFYWRENTLSWNCNDGPAMQLNKEGVIYHYFAFYED